MLAAGVSLLDRDQLALFKLDPSGEVLALCAAADSDVAAKRGPRSSSIARADVAHLMLQLLDKPASLRQPVGVSR